MTSEFDVAIVHRATGRIVVTWQPQRSETTGPIIDALCAACERKGIGMGKSRAHVLRDLREAWHEVLHALKAQV